MKPLILIPFLCDTGFDKSEGLRLRIVIGNYQFDLRIRGLANAKPVQNILSHGMMYVVPSPSP